MTSVFVALAASILGWVMLTAGLSKLRRSSPRAAPTAPALLARASGRVGLGAAESIVGVALMVPNGRAAAVTVAIAMLAAFTVLAVRDVVTRSEYACGCGGLMPEAATSGGRLARNLALLTLAIVAIAGTVGGTVELRATPHLGTVIAGLGILTTWRLAAEIRLVRGARLNLDANGWKRT